MEVYYNDFKPQGFVSAKLPEDIFSYIKEKSQISKQTDLLNTKELAGNIEESYLVVLDDKDVKEKLQKYINELIKIYEKRYEYPKKLNFLDKNLPYYVNNLWVNYQKKYEFNPSHNHPGVFGFVIWIKIPYEMEKEFNVPSVKNAKNKLASVFQFHYLDMFGIKRHNLYVDKEYEGTIILFPSFLNHQVYPFYTSDEYRISVAGNVLLKTSEN